MAITNQFVSPMTSTRKQAIERAVADVKLLPSSATVAMKVLELKRKSMSGAADFGRVIAADPAVAAKVLALANSAAFAPVTPVTRLPHAISMIGLNNLLPLVFGLSFAGIFNKLSLPAADQSLLWKGSLLKAVAARECVRHLGRFAVDADRDSLADEAFAHALLQDVSLPLFYAADRSAWPEFLAMIDPADGDRSAREAKTFGLDHATVSGACLRAMELPDKFIKMTALHHTSVARLSAAGCDVALAVALDAAALLPHRVQSLSPKIIQPLIVHVRMTSNAPAEELTALAGGVASEFAAMTALFGDTEDSGASFKQFLQNLGAEVADCLQTSITKNAVEISGLKDTEQKLREVVVQLEDKAQRAELDPLTGVLNRASFMTRLTKLLALARQHDGHCAVGFLDMDNFKHVNDTYGHAAGDAALVQMSRLLVGALGDNGIAGRVGGDEFVFALLARTGTLEQATAALSEKVGRFVTKFGGTQLDLSVSLGIVPLGVPQAGADAEDILRQADQRMYQVKRASKLHKDAAPTARVA